jgi:hypothetical protein
VEFLAKAFGSMARVFSWFVWLPKESGEEKRQLHSWRLLSLLGVLCVIFVICALIAPSPPNFVGEFREPLRPESLKRPDDERDRAVDRATAMTQKAFWGSPGGSGMQGAIRSGPGGPSGSDRNTLMILNRPGVNSANQLAAGLKFAVRLLDQLTVGDQAVPVIAEVTRGIFNDAGGGIKEGSRLFGSAQCQNGAELAQIQFQSLADDSGIVRNIQAVAFEASGQVGVAGEVHSKGLRNTAGQFVSRFIGAYAEGSQQRDFLGNSQGGAQNGLLNAVGETAKDRTNSYAEDLKKEHQWIEIPKGKEITVILTQTFTFNEPGVNQ